MADSPILTALVLGGIAAVFIFLAYYRMTLKRRYERHYEGIKDTEWTTGEWSDPFAIFSRYWLFSISIFIPLMLWGEVADFDPVYGILFVVIWLICYVPIINYFLVKPSLKGTSFKERNRNMLPGEVTSYIGMVLDDMGVPYERYTLFEYKATRPDPRLVWELQWENHYDFVVECHPKQLVDMSCSIVIGEIGDAGIYFSQIRLTPYNDGTATFFDDLSDEIDKVLL